MFLLDDLVAAPGKAVLALFQELAKKAQEEFLDDETVKRELQEIYALVETGRISDTEFESREGRLLERLEQIARAKFQQRWLADAVQEEVVPDIEVSARPTVEEPGPVRQSAVVDRPCEEPAHPALDVAEVLRTAVLRANPVEPIVPAIEEARPLVPGAPVVPAPAAVAAAVSPLVATPTAVAAAAAVGIAAAPAAIAAAARETPGALTMAQALDCALSGLSMLKVKVCSVTSVIRGDSGWQVTVEVLERRSVPDSSDLLGVYEVQLDHVGSIVRYERTRMRRRCDLGR